MIVYVYFIYCINCFTVGVSVEFSCVTIPIGADTNILFTSYIMALGITSRPMFSFWMWDISFPMRMKIKGVVQLPKKLKNSPKWYKIMKKINSPF